MNINKILIIKTGYSEILENKNNSRKVSLGDVLRTTVLLPLYQGHHVTWVTDKEAMPLLENNPLIRKLLPFDFITSLQLEAEEFDTVINLEKIPGICALIDRVKARRSRYGFRFDSQTGEAEAYEKAYEILEVGADPKLKKENKKVFQDLLFEMVGAKWNGEEYVLGYSPKSSVQYDVALNTNIGQKWPTKAWPKKNWDKLEEILTQDGIRVTRQDKQQQEVLNNLESYMDWINSAKVIVTNDSLGLHLGMAMKKNVLGLFGPTPSAEVYFYGRGEAITPKSNCQYLPCFRGQCQTEENCMQKIEVESVLSKIKKWYP